MSSDKNREKDREECFNELFQGILVSLQNVRQLFLAGIFVCIPVCFLSSLEVRTMNSISAWHAVNETGDTFKEGHAMKNWTFCFFSYST